jgi:hypothetical protein
MSKTLQYELWQECDNHCTYCTLGRNNIKTPKELKLLAINNALKDIKGLTEGEVSTLGFIGGEFFQGQIDDTEVKNAFTNLLATSNKLLQDNVIKELWINATLTKNNDSLYEILDNVITEKDKLWILTSYDRIGRFHTLDHFKNWEDNISKIHELYPEIRINTTMIITGDFIRGYLEDEIDLHEFEYKYGTCVYLKTPVKPDDLCDKTKEEINEKFKYSFFPREIDFTKFLMKYREKEGIEAYTRLFSNELKAEELHKNYNDNVLRDITFTRNSEYKETLDCDKSVKDIEESKCGHSSIYKCFVDTDGCAICCKRLIGGL